MCWLHVKSIERAQEYLECERADAHVALCICNGGMEGAGLSGCSWQAACLVAAQDAGHMGVDHAQMSHWIDFTLLELLEYMQHAQDSCPSLGMPHAGLGC